LGPRARHLQVAALLLFLAGTTPFFAGPSVSVTEKEIVVLQVRSLGAQPIDAPADGSFPLRLDSEHGASLQFDLQWPDASSISHVTLIATHRPPQSGAPHALRLEGKLELPDGARKRASRDLAFDGSTTALFELARFDERSLTLVIEANVEIETVFAARPVVGRPVVMNLEVEWLESGAGRTLETNRLSTFIGESVSYSFHMSGSEGAEGLEIRLTPLRIYGDLIQVQAEISGSVPHEGARKLLSRSEQWMISRGESSAFEIAEGEPPTGYRFIVTPRF
jgi:hypothetical protein